jgi:hypothetical protein
MTRPLLARSFLSSIARALLRGDAAIFGRFAASTVMIATALAVHGAQAFEERVVEVADQRAAVVVT